MFTGIIEKNGQIYDIQKTEKGAVITFDAPFDFASFQIGDSIAVNGICLTVVAFEGTGQGIRFKIDASFETVSRTTIPYWRIGDRMNFERPLRLSDRLGGHLVSGHVDGIGTIVRIEEEIEPMPARIVTLEVPLEIARYLVFKGSVAVDGVSLTVHACTDRTLSLNLVPHTLAVTNFGTCKVGDRMNIEVDMIGKYVEKFLGWMKPA